MTVPEQANGQSETPATRVWLAGSGRSGTTWLANLMSAAGASVTNEPLHDKRGPLPDWAALQVQRPGRLFLSADGAYPEWDALLAEIFSAARANRWTRFGMRRPGQWPEALWHHLTADRRVVKEIVSNLMLDWLSTRPQVRCVALVRHPCAVVASQYASGWRASVDSLMTDPAFAVAYLAPHETFLRTGVRSDIEHLAARWSIENMPIARLAASPSLKVIHYETLVTEIGPALDSLWRHLGWTLPPKRRQRIAAAAARPVSGLREPPDPERLLAGWQRRLGRAEIEQILAVTRRLGMGFYDHAPDAPVRMLGDAY